MRMSSRTARPARRARIDGSTSSTSTRWRDDAMQLAGTRAARLRRDPRGRRWCLHATDRDPGKMRRTMRRVSPAPRPRRPPTVTAASAAIEIERRPGRAAPRRPISSSSSPTTSATATSAPSARPSSARRGSIAWPPRARSGRRSTSSRCARRAGPRCSPAGCRSATACSAATALMRPASSAPMRRPDCRPRRSRSPKLLKTPRLRHRHRRQVAPRPAPRVPADAPRLRLVVRPALLARHADDRPARSRLGHRRLLRSQAGILGRRPDARRGGDRTARRSPHADPALHRRGGPLHRGTQGRTVLPLPRAQPAAHPAGALAGVRRQERRRHLRRRDRGARLEHRPHPRHAAARCGLDRHTLVVFTSDNGPWLPFRDARRLGRTAARGQGHHLGGRRADAGDLLVAGHRSRPATVTAIGSAMDLLPTAAALAGARLPADRAARRRQPGRGAQDRPRPAAPDRCSTTGTANCGPSARAATRRTS